MNWETLCIADHSSTSRMLYYEFAHSAKQHGAVHAQVVMPTAPTAGELDRVAVAVFESRRKRELFELSMGHEFPLINPDEPDLNWFWTAWHQQGIVL